MGTVQVLIKKMLSHSFHRTHARTPSWKYPPGEGNGGNVCLIRNYTVPMRAHNVLFTKRIKINEFKLLANLIPSCTLHSRGVTFMALQVDVRA